MPGASSSTRNRTIMMPDDLPAGFRFHPTDEELIVHYLMNQAAALPCPVPIFAEVNIYRCDPWDLPAKALTMLGGNNSISNEWYFFSPRDRKYPNGARPNRAAGSGYWKATGTDKPILSSSSVVGVKKALVFYSGRPPKGVKTDWIMHEYRLTPTAADKQYSSSSRRGSSTSMRLDDWVLCRIYKKSNDFFQLQLMSDHDHEAAASQSSTVQDQDSSSSLTTTTTNMAGGGGGGSVSVGNPNKPETLEQAHHQFRRQAADDQTPATAAAINKSCSLTDLLNTIDFSALSQMLLLDGPAADADDPPLIYNPTTHSTQHQALTNYNNNIVMNNSSHFVNNNLPSRVDSCSSDNSLKRKRTTPTPTTVAMDNGAAGSYSFDDGTANNNAFSKKRLPGDSRSSHLLGTTSSYCNPLLVDTNGFQFQPGSGLVMTSYPFLEMQ